jgi:hypothetical protein
MGLEVSWSLSPRNFALSAAKVKYLLPVNHNVGGGEGTVP